MLSEKSVSMISMVPEKIAASSTDVSLFGIRPRKFLDSSLSRSRDFRRERHAQLYIKPKF